MFIHTPEQPTDPQSLNLIVPSWSQSINRYLEREVDGVIHARSVDQFDFVNGNNRGNDHIFTSCSASGGE